MINKSLIFRKGGHQLYILKVAVPILKKLPNMLNNIQEWLELILSNWGEKTAKDTLNDVQNGFWCVDNGNDGNGYDGISMTLPIKPLQPFDLSGLHNVIDIRTFEHQQLEEQQAMKNKSNS